jgi:hypothetical protein
MFPVLMIAATTAVMEACTPQVGSKLPQLSRHVYSYALSALITAPLYECVAKLSSRPGSRRASGQALVHRVMLEAFPIVAHLAYQPRS